MLSLTLQIVFEDIMEIIERPWGHYKVLLDKGTIKVKELIIYPFSAFSLQAHNHREEHWVCTEGSGNVHLAGSDFPINAGDYVKVHKCEKHRITNTTASLLRIIEVQTGDYLSEDDIIRYEDKYGRK